MGREGRRLMKNRNSNGSGHDVGYFSCVAGCDAGAGDGGRGVGEVCTVWRDRVGGRGDLCGGDYVYGFE